MSNPTVSIPLNDAKLALNLIRRVADQLYGARNVSSGTLFAYAEAEALASNLSDAISEREVPSCEGAGAEPGRSN